jgi:hypothetical protein
MGQLVTGGSAPSWNFNFSPQSGPFSGQVLSANRTLQALFKVAGVLADQVDTLYADTLTFVASTPQIIDLTNITAQTILGNPVDFARVRFIAIRVNSITDGQVLLVGDSVTNEWDAFLSAAGILTVFPGTAANNGFFVLSAPNTTGMVVSGSHKTLKLDPGANAFTVDIVIAGCSD